MQAYEAIKRLKADRKEFLEMYGLKSHMSKIPAELEAELFGEEKKIQTGAEPTEATDRTEAIVLETEEVCPYPLKAVRKSIHLLGNKSKAWKWRHLLG